MKKLLLLTVVGACIAAGQEAVPTVVEGATYQFGNTYVGAHSTEKWLDGGDVTVREGAEGADLSSAMVVGNENDGVGQRAYWGKVTMTGGEVDSLIAVWCPHGDAGHGTVVMQGGTAHSVIGGQSVDHEAYNNTVIMTGGTAKEVLASNSGSAAATFNNIYLIGKGGEATIDNVHYTHTEDISIKRLYGATGNDLTHNSIDFYGTGIDIGRMDNADILAFHLTAETSDAILNITLPLDLIDVSLNFTTPASFAALPLGTAITLISTPAAIYLSDEQLARTYTITDGSSPLTTAHLSYTEGLGLSLHLAPEPQTPPSTSSPSPPSSPAAGGGERAMAGSALFPPLRCFACFEPEAGGIERATAHKGSGEGGEGVVLRGEAVNRQLCVLGETCSRGNRIPPDKERPQRAPIILPHEFFGVVNGSSRIDMDSTDNKNTP